jgi:hypothetical protein
MERKEKKKGKGRESARLEKDKKLNDPVTCVLGIVSIYD